MHGFILPILSFVHIMLQEVNTMLFSELRCKEVININNCKKLGNVTDLEFDHCTGKICSITVQGKFHFLSCFTCDAGCVIQYAEIKQIGPDIILVDI